MRYLSEPVTSGYEFWLKAAEWGSYMRDGDPGACMYGFDERGTMQSEEHRRQCLSWIKNHCWHHATRAGKRELDFLRDYILVAPVEGKRRDERVKSPSYGE